MLSDRGNNARTTKVGWEHFNDYIYAYTYDANGNITLITRRNKNIQNSTYENQQQFAYDELNQLIRADDLAKNCTEVYNYDNGGNILSVTTYPLTWGSLNGVTATQTINYAYGDTNWKDKLTSYNGTAITYDSIGNPLSYRGYTLTWQNGRQLATLNENGKTASYTYDVDGLRTSKTVNGVVHDYYYVGDRLQYEKFGTREMWFFYDADGNPSGFKYQNGSTVYNYYYVCNWRGDVIALYANDGLKYTYEYDAWGKMLAIRNVSGEDVTGAANIANYNPLRYRGYYYDSETGLYYINSRYYDPTVKRFVNSDDDLLSATSPQALIDKNYFTYCDNNPVGRADGEGDCWHIVIGATVGGMLSATTQVIEQGGIHSKKDIAKVAVSLVTGAISGGVGATGIGLFASAGIDAGLTMFTSFGMDLIDNDFTLGNVDWWGIVADTSKTVNGVKHDYYYIGSNLQYEKYGTTELWFYYDSDGNPSGVRYKNGNTTSDYYFTCNWRGDVVKIYDATGSFVANYDYDAWGNVISVTNENGTVITSSTHIANVNPIRYRGYYYDSETGLYYVSSRYYNPETCRFINADDTDTLTATMDDVTDKNLFAYCDNNPIMRVDEDGEFWKLALASGGIGGSS